MCGEIAAVPDMIGRMELERRDVEAHASLDGLPIARLAEVIATAPEPSLRS
ncbi:MAG: hypothetical protein QOH12_2113 [Solirubrobacteraceae bacterium]|jgi:hypothetical protein|nr:hypothetical protein [Solirubrobacteraceae bacterium]